MMRLRHRRRQLLCAVGLVVLVVFLSLTFEWEFAHNRVWTRWPPVPSASVSVSSPVYLPLSESVSLALQLSKVRVLPVCEDQDQVQGPSRGNVALKPDTAMSMSMCMSRGQVRAALREHALKYLSSRSQSRHQSQSQVGLAGVPVSGSVSVGVVVPSPPLSLLVGMSLLHGRCSRGLYSTWTDAHVQQQLHRPDFHIHQRMRLVSYDEIQTRVTAELDQLGRGEVSWDDYGARISHPCVYPSHMSNRNIVEMKPVGGEKEGELRNSRDEFHTLHEYSSVSRIEAKYLPGKWLGWICGTANMWHSFVDDMVDVFAVMEHEHFDYIVQLPATPQHQDLSGVGGFVALLGVAWLSVAHPHVKLVHWPNATYSGQDHQVNKHMAICTDHITYPRKMSQQRGGAFHILSGSMLSRLRRGVFSMLGIGDSSGVLPEVLTHINITSTSATTPAPVQHTNKSYRITVYDRKDAWKRVWLNARDLLSRLAPHHSVLYISDMPAISSHDQVRIYANTEILISEHGAGQMATLFLPYGAISVQVTSWWDQPYGYLNGLEGPDKLGLRSGTVSCSTWENKPFTHNNQSNMEWKHHNRNGEHTICNPDTIINKIKHTWGIDLTQTTTNNNNT